MSEPAPIVLVVDDEIQIRRFLRTGFELNGFVVHEAGTGAEAVRTATLRPIDLAIVDLGLPDMDGAEVVERIRSWSSVPIIVLSVRSAEAEKVRLLELGADDYVVKPFGMAELLARVRVALRRQMRAVSGEPTVKAGPLTIDLAARAVLLNDKRLTLTPKEYRLLQVLAQHAGNVVTHQHGDRSTFTTLIICASSFASCARRSSRIRTPRRFWSPSWVSDTALCSPVQKAMRGLGPTTTPRQRAKPRAIGAGPAPGINAGSRRSALS